MQHPFYKFFLLAAMLITPLSFSQAQDQSASMPHPGMPLPHSGMPFNGPLRQHPSFSPPTFGMMHEHKLLHILRKIDDTLTLNPTQQGALDKVISGWHARFEKSRKAHHQAMTAVENFTAIQHLEKQVEWSNLQTKDLSMTLEEFKSFYNTLNTAQQKQVDNLFKNHHRHRFAAFQKEHADIKAIQ